MAAQVETFTFQAETKHLKLANIRRTENAGIIEQEYGTSLEYSR